jgi:outer membrane protein assembly factor BamB
MRYRTRVSRLGLIGVIAVLAPMVTGCDWLQPGFDAEGTRHNPSEPGLTAANVAALTQRWSVDLAATQLFEPVVAQGRVFVTSDDSSNQTAVRAYSTADGTSLWSQPVGMPIGIAVETPATFFGPSLWLAHGDSSTAPCPLRLTSLDPATGAVLTSEPANFLTSGPVTGGSVAAFVTSDGCNPAGGGHAVLVVRDIATQTTQWTHVFAGGADGLRISDGLMYVSHEGTTDVFAAGGCGASSCDPLRTIPGGPLSAVTGGKTFSVTHQTFNLGHGVTSTIATLTVRSTDTGAALWSASYAGTDPLQGANRGEISGVAVADDTVYVAGWRDAKPVGTFTLDAYPIDGSGTGPRWTALLPGFGTTPVIAGDVAYVVAGSHVMAFDARGCGTAACSPLANVAVPGDAKSMSVADGTVFVGSTGPSAGTGHLTAYGIPS